MSSKALHAATAAAFSLIALILFLINIQFPRTFAFDEYHFVPAAQKLITLQDNIDKTHPPLGKFLIGLGVLTADDRPFGWRWPSAVFGAATLFALYGIAFLLFRSWLVASLVAFVTLFNQLLYVQSRIAMLDVFMFGFFAWGLFFLIWCWNDRTSPPYLHRRMVGAGIFFGFAAACKWSAWIYLWGIWGLFILFGLLKYWKVSFGKKAPAAKTEVFYESWFSRKFFRTFRPAHYLGYLVGIPALVYILSFVPLTRMRGDSLNLVEVLQLNWSMLLHHLQPAEHPYSSPWWEWPLMLRPTWYGFDREGLGGEEFRGMVLLGNPFVMFLGLLSTITCGVMWVRTRTNAFFWPAFLFCIFYFSWALVPARPSFYYYFYPAAMMYSLSIGALVRWLEIHRTIWAPRAAAGIAAVTLGMFAYFFPILAALRSQISDLPMWTWFSGWI